VQQAILNVLTNALKYSQPPAPVTLSLAAVESDGRRHVRLRVVDAGIGMTPEQCRRAFERFYRADPSGQVLGAGLGLAIVKEIVELHQGSVAIHSTPGAGTQVTLRLPLRGAPGSAGRRGPAEPVDESTTDERAATI
jgi:signal transduction histidine kinase